MPALDDVALLILRLVIGGVFIAHGVRKLGLGTEAGVRGFAGSIARRGYRPAPLWAAAAIASEIGGGTFLILGLLSPFAAAVLVAQAVTIVALVGGRGFWVEDMGIEYPLALGVGALAAGWAGPGSLSLDAALGLVVDPALAVGALAVTIAGAVAGLLTRRPPATMA
jgi:putative oxidoreductase